MYPYTLCQSTPPLGTSLLNWLTYLLQVICTFIIDVVEEEEPVTDWLYAVISDIISNHNSIINYAALHNAQHRQLAFLPKTPAKILPMEVDLKSAIITSME